MILILLWWYSLNKCFIITFQCNSMGLHSCTRETNPMKLKEIKIIQMHEKFGSTFSDLSKLLEDGCTVTANDQQLLSAFILPFLLIGMLIFHAYSSMVITYSSTCWHISPTEWCCLVFSHFTETDFIVKTFRNPQAMLSFNFLKHITFATWWKVFDQQGTKQITHCFKFFVEL